MNGVGFGPVSPTVTCVCDTEPTAMGDITASMVHPYNITLTWNDLTYSSNGGDVPNFYLLQYFVPTNASWVSLTTDGISGKLLTYTHEFTSLFNPAL